MLIFIILTFLAIFFPLIQLIYYNENNNNNNNSINNHYNNKLIDHDDRLKFLNGEKDLSHYDLLIELKINKFQVFYINKYNVSDIKLPYELVSAKKSISKKDQLFKIDDEDCYFKFILYTSLDDNNQYIDVIIDDNISKCSDIINNYHNCNYDQFKKQVKDYFDRKMKKFINQSNFDDDQDLLSYYKVIINNKKLSDDELNEYLIVYYKVKNQLERLNELNKHKKINNALNQSSYTSGYSQSKLNNELIELTNRENS